MSDLTPWICIARAGTFQDSQGREHTFTEADLEAIRAGYDPAQSEAPLVFGHPKDSDPAFGWVAALKREGEKLFAQFAAVPAEVKKLVQDCRYRAFPCCSAATTRSSFPRKARSRSRSIFWRSRISCTADAASNKRRSMKNGPPSKNSALSTRPRQGLPPALSQRK